MRNPPTPVMLVQPLLTPVGQNQIASKFLGKGGTDAVFLFKTKLYYFNHKTEALTPLISEGDNYRALKSDFPEKKLATPAQLSQIDALMKETAAPTTEKPMVNATTPASDPASSMREWKAAVTSINNINESLKPLSPDNNRRNKI